MSTLFKKVASTISVGAILASSVGSSIVAAASGFLPYAEALADAKVITKQANEAGYRLADNALRQEVVAMAVAASKATSVDTCAGKFSDVSATKPNSWVCKVAETALAKGLIAANATFRPEAKITRAEALAMILKGQGIEIPTATTSSFNDVKEAWQVNVAEVALSKKIISANASFRPSDLVTRGELFVMAANAAGLQIASDDLNLDDLFGDDTTSTGTTSTGTTGDTGTVVKAGDLNVSLSPTSPAENSSIPQAGIVRFATVDLKAGANDISVNSIEVKKSGLFSIDTSTRAWFEVDGMRISGRSSFTSEGNVVLSFAPALVVKAGATQSIDFIVELNGSSSTDYKFVSGELNTSAANVTGNFTTPTLRSSNYIVSGFNYGITSSDATYNVNGDEEYELGAFKVVATKTGSITETRDLNFKSIVLYQNESANLTNLKDLVLVRDGVVVSTKATIDGKAVVFSVKDTVKDGATAIYYVRAKVATLDNSIDKYQFYVKKSSDIVLYEVQSGVRASGNNLTSTTSEACYSNTYSLKGSDVSFSRDDTVSLSATYAPGSSNVVLMKGYIEAKQAVNLEDPTLNINITNASGAKLSDYFSTAYMSVGNSSLSASAPSTILADNDETLSLAFNGTVTISGKVPVTVYVNLKSGSSLPSATFKLDELKLESFTGTKEYVANGNTVDTAVGTVSAITATIANSTLSVTRNDGIGDTYIAVGSKSVNVFGAQLSSTQGNPVRITSLTFDFASTFSGATATGFVNNAYATLYVDGTAIKSKTINDTEVKFDGFNFDVSTTTSKNIALKVDFSDAFGNDNTFKATLAKYEATDTVSSTDLTNSSLNLAGATFTIANASATLAISNDTPKTILVTAGATSTKLLTFRITAKNDVINLKKVVFSGSKLDSFTNYSIKDSAGKTVNANSASSNQVLFDNINADTFKINQDATSDLYVYADAKTNTNTGLTTLALNSMTIRGSNGKELSSATTATATTFVYTADSIVSNGADVYENTAKIAAVSPVSKNIASDAMRFSITASGKNGVTLNSLTLTGVLSGYTGAYTVEVRKVSDDTLISSGVTASTLSTINFASNIVVDAGKTETYYIKLAGIAIDSGSQQSDWTLKLTNFVISPISGTTVNLASYPQNTDTLPLTSSK